MSKAIVNAHYFEILPEEPTDSYIHSIGNPSYMRFEINGRSGWVIFKTKESHKLFNYLISKKDYKAKEQYFGIDSDIFEATVGNTEKLDFIVVKLRKPFVINDNKIKRELSVYVTNKDTENINLLHELYLRMKSLI